MNCIIIEDQLPAQRILKRYIEDIGTLRLIGTYSDALQAIDTINTQSIDLLFLDIHLPKISGIDFLKTLPNASHVILTTAFSDYALESYEFNVVDYLLKPFSFERFVKAVSKVTALRQAASSERKGGQNQEIFIKSGYEHIRINLTDIYYIKSDADYTEIHLSSKKHLSSESLKNWEEQLTKLQFVRVHKSYLINTAKIDKIVGNQIYLIGSNVIPIGRAYKEELLKKYIM
ncbi:two component transcriptional regulator, LytTR family [Reichenbachiella faecimaris]|uniref:Two component transcriptional regulator, LytTR family n=1 Tax=Reichenbachiella faecimaris TaxID=692418 RepID=A0A1W2GGM5_REIFA|nr:LytTR family DNA-binding domain-containing protein [Reichenbachiella faecimaris]SMD35815.1 two component transcriptional regulator, LytTR family [Reichenbachiella faecimaris]